MKQGTLLLVVVLVVVIGTIGWLYVLNNKNGKKSVFEEESDNGEAGVVVTAKLDSVSKNSGKEDLVFEIAINTHTVDLSDFDVMSKVRLVSGKVSKSPKKWEEDNGSIHHKSGKLTFDSLMGLGGKVEMVVYGLGGTAERRIVWGP